MRGAAHRAQNPRINRVRYWRLDQYYRTNVIGGPSAFVMVAKNFESFGEAIILKLIAEVAQGSERGAKEFEQPGRTQNGRCTSRAISARALRRWAITARSNRVVTPVVIA